jgi:hypothetical protein
MHLDHAKIINHHTAIPAHQHKTATLLSLHQQKHQNHQRQRKSTCHHAVAMISEPFSC